MVLHREKKQFMLWMGILVVIACLCSLLWSRPAAASGSIELRTEAGYDGKMKEGQWFPVKFVVTSTSEDVSGDLVVQIANPIGGNDTTYIKSVDLPKQTSKVVWMSLPGVSYNEKNNSIKFYKGGISKGEIMPISKGNNYITTAPTQSIQVGVLARDTDTLNFLSLLQSKNMAVTVIHLKPEQLPGESVMLDSLDVLALNDFASDQLKEDQVKAITSWVNRGGTLVLAGGAGYPKTAKAFESLSPVAYTGTASLYALSSLEQASGKELKLGEPFTISTSGLRAGEVITQEQQQPLFAKKNTGSGEVWYVAYDLALNPIASWSGNPEIWEKVLQRHSGPTNLKQVRPGGNSVWDQFREIQYTLDYFPSLEQPSFFTLLIAFLIYVVLVAPILYLLLKKMDKREWAWIMIPAISILSSLVIFIIGSSDKRTPLIHTLNTLELDGNGNGQRISAAAVFVPNGGSYELEAPKATQTVVADSTNQNSGYYNQLTGISEQYIRQDAEKTQIQWSDVPYWSVRKAWMKSDDTEQLGKFEVNLAADSNGLKGEISNGTKSDLTDIHILLNRKIYSVGELKVGEKKPIALASPSIANSDHDYGHLLFNTATIGGYRRGNMDIRERERQMINSYMNSKGLDHEKPLIVGWSKDKQSLFQVTGKNAKSDQLNMWIQEIDLQVVQGDKVSIPAGYASPKIVNSSTNQLIMESNGKAVINNGSVTFEYRLPRIQDVSYSKLDMRLPAGTGHSPSLTWELWNGESQAWEPLDLRAAVEKKEHLQAYILNDGTTIRMKAVTTQQTGFHFPEVALEGTVRR